MARYVLVESRDPFESHDVPYFYGLAGDLAASGEEVALFLVQNGALATRKEATDNPLGGVLERKVEVLVDAFSLKERGILKSEMDPAVKPATMNDLIDRIMEAGTKVLWH